VGNDRLTSNLIKLAWRQKQPYPRAITYNENSLEQATLFIKTVSLKKGDLPPVLDIERLPKNQSVDR
jgi:lysozyme